MYTKKKKKNALNVFNFYSTLCEKLTWLYYNDPILMNIFVLRNFLRPVFQYLNLEIYKMLLKNYNVKNELCNSIDIYSREVKKKKI